MEFCTENEKVYTPHPIHESKVKKKCKKPSVEAIKVTIEKKRKCISRALEIVTRFSEEIITETCLIENVQFINQEQYQDIVEERGINKMCGYPPCSSHLQNIPRKKYHICTSHNKVFDITDRKNYCSNMCYKASKYLKDQILTSPLWLRENVSPITYKLISLHSKGGTVGDEVDLGFSPVKIDEDDSGCIANKDTTYSSENNSLGNLQTTSFKNVNQDVDTIEDYSKTTRSRASSLCLYEGNENSSQVFKSEKNVSIKTNILLDEIPTSSNDVNLKGVNENVILSCNEHQTKTNKIGQRTDTASDNTLLNETKCDKSDQIADTTFDNMPLNESNSDKIGIKSDKTSDNITLKVLNKEKQNKESIVTKERQHTKPIKKCKKSLNNDSNVSSSMQIIVRKIEQTVKDWFSIDSFCLIFGEEKLREIFLEKNICDTEFNNLGSKSVDPYIYEKYLAICKKLNVLELEDTKIDMSFKEESKKPLPDYDALKKEAKEFELKAKMFYKGDKIVQFTDENSSHQRDSVEQEVNLPLVDLHAQKALRRRIVLDKIKRVLPDLQKSLCLRDFNLFEEIKMLVNTFDLSSHNITMRPVEWNLITIILVKLLSIKDKTLEKAVNSSQTKKNLTLLLMSYALDSCYLDRLIVWLADIDYGLQKKN